MAVSKDLLDVLVCTESRSALIYFSGEDGGEEFLFCPVSRLKYRVDDGIPVMLVSEAERLDDAGADAVMVRAAELGLA